MLETFITFEMYLLLQILSIENHSNFTLFGTFSCLRGVLFYLITLKHFKLLSSKVKQLFNFSTILAQPSSHFRPYIFFNLSSIKAIQTLSCSGHSTLYGTNLVLNHILPFLHNSIKFSSKVDKIFHFSAFGMFRRKVWVRFRVGKQ